MKLADIQTALAEARYESARRLGISLLKTATTERADIVLALHDAFVALADFQSARDILELRSDDLKGREFETKLRLASDFRKLSEDTNFRISAETRKGFTYDEYQAKYLKLASDSFEMAREFAVTDAQKAALDRSAQGKADEPFSTPAELALSQTGAIEKAAGSLRGRILWEDGSPAGMLEVTLGLQAKVDKADPVTFVSHAMHYAPKIGPLSKLTATTDAEGRFGFTRVPAGQHEFIAVTLPEEEPGIRTRFLDRNILIESGAAVEVGDLRVTSWQSAPSRVLESPNPDSFVDSGVTWTKLAETTLSNPFFYDFPRQLLLLPRPETTDCLRLVIDSNRTGEPYQIVNGQLAFLTELPAKTDKHVAIYGSDLLESPTQPKHPVTLSKETRWTLNSGVAAFQLAGENCAIGMAPVLAVRGPDGEWRGQGRFCLPDGIKVTDRKITVLEKGPILTTIQYAYELSNGAAWSLEVTALAGEPLLLARETSCSLESASFEFSLREFSGGRGFLHWNPETGSRHWRTLEPEDEVVGRLPESIPWWIPPQGFGYAMTADGLESRDYIGVFTRRRGEWIDRDFERIAQGPINADGTENRELDWPFPEMVGSSISMINVHTSADGDAFFRFGFFDGERQWGILASSFDQNDGAFKQFGRIQHAYSSPRLQEFKDWHFDVADSHPRPHVLVDRAELPNLRKKTARGEFAGLWNKIDSQRIPGAREGLIFAVKGDPLAAWFKRIQLLAIADVRSKMTLLGRDFSDHYSPVGGRDITKWAEEYDLIVASGVFSAEEERTIRSFLILMAHLYMEEDFMNWRFNGRNANFEADRADIIAAVGLVFEGHPDSPKFLDHVIERTKRSLIAYCTPGSGKWYENPACYYLHASKCRMNLVYHLGHKGLLDLETVPRLKDFLRWGIHLLTPPHPIEYNVMHDGNEEAFLAAPKIRKVPPIGDHAGIGRWVPEHYAFIGKLFLKSDPEFGRELINAYFCGNADGQRLLGKVPWENDSAESYPQAPHHGAYHGNLPLFFSAIDENDLPEDPTLTPTSRRLEGFGAILRNNVNTERESCLLIKQGPGGYRYHRTEGSFLLFVDGRPLVFDGGEAGETWRHSTLSFHDVHMPLSPGHVERYFDRSGFQFVQGVHPVILQPGEPVFLSDSCRHELVEESYRRFNMEPPAVVRSFAWVDDSYLLIHDDLTNSRPDISHWHLQVVGEAPTVTQGNHFRFPGRFGIDLEVVLPGQTFASNRVAPLPITYYDGTPDQWFTMQHLQLGRPNASHYLAAMRPVRSGEQTQFLVQAIEENGELNGARVQNGESEDLLWFRRAGLKWSNKEIRFNGSFGALLKKPSGTRLVLMGSGDLETGWARLQSDGPSAALSITTSGTLLEATGAGRITVSIQGKSHEFTIESTAPLSVSIS